MPEKDKINPVTLYAIVVVIVLLVLYYMRTNTEGCCGNPEMFTEGPAMLESGHQSSPLQSISGGSSAKYDTRGPTKMLLMESGIPQDIIVHDSLYNHEMNPLHEDAMQYAMFHSNDQVYF